MSRKTIFIFFFLAVISLAGVVITQIYWVKRAYNLQEKQFNDRVTIAMTGVVERILTINQDSAVVEPVKQLASNFFVANINDTLHPFLLEALLKEEFLQSNLTQDFEYGIYDCFNDSIVFGGKVSFNEPELRGEAEEITSQQRFDRDGHYFGVYFPEKPSFLLDRMDFWIYSSLVIVLIVIFFAYAMTLILRQKRLSEVKSDFINNMTHELKTPISTIALSSEVLLGQGIEGNPERLKQYARIIRNENNRLQAQVDRVLQVATLSPDKLKLKEEELDIHEIITHAVETFEITAQEKQGKISTSLRADQPIIRGDRVHITNIVYNLLDNACKYTDVAPKIEISTSNEGNSIEIVVKDNGIGIAPDELKHIFEKFYRVPTGNIHNVKGFGLGLYYVKTIVSAHHGRIIAKSNKGEGSEFRVKLPLYRKHSRHD
jgi:two-component system phosphate regulon sensor histidine kinase PhoR